MIDSPPENFFKLVYTANHINNKDQWFRRVINLFLNITKHLQKRLFPKGGSQSLFFGLYSKLISLSYSISEHYYWLNSTLAKMSIMGCK